MQKPLFSESLSDTHHAWVAINEDGSEQRFSAMNGRRFATWKLVMQRQSSVAMKAFGALATTVVNGAVRDASNR